MVILVRVCCGCAVLLQLRYTVTVAVGCMTADNKCATAQNTQTRFCFFYFLKQELAQKPYSGAESRQSYGPVRYSAHVQQCWRRIRMALHAHVRGVSRYCTCACRHAHMRAYLGGLSVLEATGLHHHAADATAAQEGLDSNSNRTAAIVC